MNTDCQCLQTHKKYMTSAHFAICKLDIFAYLEDFDLNRWFNFLGDF